jgi:hypothetical protein
MAMPGLAKKLRRPLILAIGLGAVGALFSLGFRATGAT